MDTAKIMKQLQEAFPAMKVTEKDGNVIATGKDVEMNAGDLKVIAKIIGTNIVTMGRSAANFRMIISEVN